MDKNELLQKAQGVLLGNLYEVKLNGKLYRRTVPSKEFYVHQWNWDSATHAMGLVYVNEQRAYDELESLVSGQWDNGLIAQITFNPNETKYFPGYEFWGTEKHRIGDIVTSGITQPPLLGISFVHVYKETKSKRLKNDLINNILPKVIKYHEYLKTYRDNDNSGLLTVVHPWESGMENSPRWDSPLNNIKLDQIPDEVKISVNKHYSGDNTIDPKHRPGMKDYYKYMYLVWLFKNMDWDYQKITKESPFAVKDILFNALWTRANEDLAEILKENDIAQSKRFNEWAKHSREALNNCWDKSLALYKDIDVSQGKYEFIEENTISTFVPLWAKAANEAKLTLLLEKLEDPQQYKSANPVPTTAMNSPKFNLTKYWRGPTWPITNLFVIEGLNVYKSNSSENRLLSGLINKTISMIKNNGFFEYFDPTSGEARPDKKQTVLGFGSFSWTAAIVLFLLNKYKKLIS